VFFISTHLDDVVLSCSYFLLANPGSTVVTVLAGAPEKQHEGYNSNTTGERYAPDAVQKRRKEDAAALSLFSAKPIWLSLFDNDYINKDPRTDDQLEIMDSISHAINQGSARSIVAPLGFVHSDHIAVSNACVKLAINSDLEWFFYMDMPYTQRYPDSLAARLSELQKLLGLEALEPLEANGEIKLKAFKLYGSQYEPTGGGKVGFESEMLTPEQYWRVLR
jgi:LmbE family N-acetylglucosaminyl deacetylase